MTRTYLRPEGRRLAAPHRFLALAVAIAGLVAPALAGTALAERRLVDITINPASASVIPGGTQAFTATGVYSDGSSEDLTSQVAWKARDPKVASIDATGLATGIGSGRSDINATLASARVTSRRAGKLNVADLDAVSVDPVSSNVRIGGRVVLKALATYDNGTSGVDITSQVVWSSKRRSVVVVETNDDGAPVAVGVARGETNVEATEPESDVRSDSTTGKITVVGPILAITVTPEDRLVRVGERVRFRATGAFERGLTTDVSGDVDWSTGDPSIATVDIEGRATGASLGSTTVVATDRQSGVTSTASGADGRIDVVGNLTSLEVKPTPLSLALGAKTNMKASARFEGITKSVNMTTKVEWSSSDPTKVSVTRLGVASCLATGTAVITVRDPFSGITSTASGHDALVRCGVPVTGVVISPDHLSMRVGKSKKVKAFLLYADGSRDEITKRVVWETSNAVVSTIDQQEPNIGRVHALTLGSATVSADDPVTGYASTAPGGTSLAVTVVP